MSINHKMSILPPLIETDRFMEEFRDEEYFKELIFKLFQKDATINGYKFNPNSGFNENKIDGWVQANYPGVEGKVVFQFKLFKETVENGSKSFQLEKLLRDLVDSKVEFSAYILVTPEDISADQEIVLNKFKQGTGLDLRYFGHTKLVELMSQYPGLLDYFYGKYIEGFKDFAVVEKIYKQSLLNHVKSLDIFGLSSPEDDKKLKRIELMKVFIQPKFISARKETEETNLLKLLSVPSRHFVILGGPGAGKSTLAKYIISQMCRNNSDIPEQKEGKRKIPFLINLCEYVQYINSESKDINFFGFLQKSIASLDEALANFPIEFITLMFELNNAMIIFDGLDEIEELRVRSKVINDIKQISKSFKKNIICVTSRIYGYENVEGFSPDKFEHYYLSPLSPEQANKFIREWYEVQMPSENLLRKAIIQNLDDAFCRYPYLGWFKKNPLYLTMLVIINTKKLSFPPNRLELYEIFLKLILKTWPEKKIGHENSLKKHNIDYEIQQVLLANVAHYIVNTNQNFMGNAEGGWISKEALNSVLYNSLDRMEKYTKSQLKEIVTVFLHYMVNSTGFLVRKKRVDKNQGEDSMFSYIHFSFIHYFDAFHKTTVQMISENDFILFILDHFDEMLCKEDFILFCIHMLERQSSNFIITFYHKFLNCCKQDRNANAWLLLGYALRDNIEFESKAAKQIITVLFERWLKGVTISYNQEPNWNINLLFSILWDIANYLTNYKNFFVSIIKENLARDHAPKVFASLYFLLYDRKDSKLYNPGITKNSGKPVFLIDEEIIDVLKNNLKLDEVLTYLPTFLSVLKYGGDELLSNFIYEKMQTHHWAVYYCNAYDRPLHWIEIISSFETKEDELRGFILSGWSKLLTSFQKRNDFLAQEYSIDGQTDSKIKWINFGADGSNLSRPLWIFRDYINSPVSCSVPLIRDRLFMEWESCIDELLEGENSDYLEKWIGKIINITFQTVNKTLKEENQYCDNELEGIQNTSSELGKNFSNIFEKYFFKTFKKNFKNFFEEQFIWDNLLSTSSFICYLEQFFNEDVSAFVKGNLFDESDIGAINLQFAVHFQRYLVRSSQNELNEDVTHGFIDCLLNARCQYSSVSAPSSAYQQFKKYITAMIKNMRQNEENDESLSKADIRMIYSFINSESFKNVAFFRLFYICLHEHLLMHSSSVSFSEESLEHSKHHKPFIMLSRFHFSISSAYLIPFLFDFIMGIDLYHYLAKFFVDLKYNLKEKDFLESLQIQSLLQQYLHENPFISYFINYFWNSICKNFLEKYNREQFPNPIELSALITFASTLTLHSDNRCLGKEWERITYIADRSDHLFVKISLTLYRLSIFENTEMNTMSLLELLKKMYINYPTYFRLLGIGNSS